MGDGDDTRIDFDLLGRPPLQPADGQPVGGDEPPGIARGPAPGQGDALFDAESPSPKAKMSDSSMPMRRGLRSLTIWARRSHWPIFSGSQTAG